MQFYFMCISFRRKVTYTNTYDMCYSKKRHCRRFMLVSNVNQCIQIFFLQKKEQKYISIKYWFVSCKLLLYFRLHNVCQPSADKVYSVHNNMLIVRLHHSQVVGPDGRSSSSLKERSVSYFQCINSTLLSIFNVLSVVLLLSTVHSEQIFSYLCFSDW